MHEPSIKQRYESESAEVVASTPEEFRKFIANEIAKWSKVVKDAGVKIE
jgi:tripartite-type tricarboxylate transporter receptor subunit TctC